MTDTSATPSTADTRPPWVALFGDDAPDSLATPYEIRRRRRRMLALSMLLIVPIGVFAIAVMLNVIVAAGAANAYAQKDYLGSASWSRASVSLNPLDTFTPHYNLGTAYAKAGLLDDGRKELTTAVKNAPSAEEQCYARANLALTYEKLGDRATKNGDTQTAQKNYLDAAVLWQRSPQDTCFQNQQFSDKADAANERLGKKLQQNQQQQQQQQGQQGQQGQSGGQQGQGQGGQSGDQQGQGGQGGDQQGQGGQSGDQQGQGDQSGDQQGQGSQSPTQQGQTGDQGQGQGDPSQQSPPSGEGQKDTSKTLGEKLGELQTRDGQATRARDQGDRTPGGGTSKPW